MSPAANAPARNLGGRPRKPPEDRVDPTDRVSIISFKGSADFADAFEQLHRKSHIPKTTIIRLALAEWAEKHGYGTLPEA